MRACARGGGERNIKLKKCEEQREILGYHVGVPRARKGYNWACSKGRVRKSTDKAW